MTYATDRTPPAWKKGKLSYGAGLTLEAAKKMLEAGEQEAEKRGVPMTIAIADAGGNLLALTRMDEAILCSTQVAMDKAFTAVFGKQHTGNHAIPYQSGILIPLFFHERWITFGGGFPIINNGTILGGIGVSGGTIEDIYVARAALKAGGFSVDEADAAIAQIESMGKE
jgi:uncharacterized protein GlcG (DUF336 family)